MVNGTKNFIRTLVLDRPGSRVEDIIDQLQRKGRCASRLAVASVRRDFLETMTLLHDRRLIDGSWKTGKPSYQWQCKGRDKPQANERRKIGAKRGQNRDQTAGGIFRVKEDGDGQDSVKACSV